MMGKTTAKLMEQRQSSYESINDIENEDDQSLIPFQSALNKSHRRLPRFLALIAVLTLTLLLTLPCAIPTMQEFEIARENDLNAWTAVLRIRQAQSVADSSLSFLSSGSLGDVNRAFRKVDDKNGAKHYMEPPDGCEASVIILRHCEKGHIREHCDYVGYERSVYIASLFGDDKERWPAPSYIFAEGPGQRRNKDKMNFREIETVGPLSQKIGVPIDDR